MLYQYLFSDLHSNIHHEQIGHIEEWYDQAKEMLDFWSIAYYPYYVRKDKTGIPLENL